MKFQIIPADQCPHRSPILAEVRKETPHCIMISNPFSDESRNLMRYLVKEFGANSEAYLKCHRTCPSKYKGTGSGAIAVASYIRPYLIDTFSNVIAEQVNGVVAGFFFHENIKNVILLELYDRGAEQDMQLTGTDDNGEVVSRSLRGLSAV